MSEVSTSGIVKKDAIRRGEPLLLGCPAVQPGNAADQDVGQVRLVEQTPSGALIEVTCGCGKMIKVNCLYSSPGLQSPAATGTGIRIPEQQGE